MKIVFTLDLPTLDAPAEAVIRAVRLTLQRIPNATVSIEGLPVAEPEGDKIG